MYQPAIAYDEAAERTVVMGALLGVYDASADRWERIAGLNPGGLPGSMVYDPVNERLVVLGRRHPSNVRPDRVAAIDLSTRDWTILFKPSLGEPAP